MSLTLSILVITYLWMLSILEACMWARSIIVNKVFVNILNIDTHSNWSDTCHSTWHVILILTLIVHRRLMAIFFSSNCCSMALTCCLLLSARSKLTNYLSSTSRTFMSFCHFFLNKIGYYFWLTRMWALCSYTNRMISIALIIWLIITMI